MGGEKIKVSFDAELLKPIPVGSQLKVDMTLGGSHLPCMDVTEMLGLPTEFRIGSCEYDVDIMLNTMEKLGAGNHCSLYDCKLPIPAGKYGTKAFEANIPKIPPMIVRDLEGKLEAH